MSITGLSLRFFAGSGQRNRVRLGLIWAGAIAALVPVFLGWKAPEPSKFRTHLAIDASYIAALIVCGALIKVELPQLGIKRAISLVFLIFLLSSTANQIHNFNVDRASNYAPPFSNEALQEHLQDDVIRLSPSAVPHSYRFLPNALVYCLQLCGVRFDVARDIYRLITGLLLFYFIYRFARLYTDLRGAVMALVLVSVIYPISFELYIGQLTDPMSHLSFVLAFIFIETDNFALLLTTLLLGSLAKESVLALSGFYLLSAGRRRNYVWKAGLLCFLSIGVFLAVRLFVLHGAMQYRQISNPGPNHVWENLGDTKWQRLFLLTGGAYLPFLALGWNKTPVVLRGLACYLLPVTFLSSLFFGWLSETRNWMPAVFVLAVVTARYWQDDRAIAFPSDKGAGAPAGSEKERQTAIDRSSEVSSLRK